jgi:hypothetical protein
MAKNSLRVQNSIKIQEVFPMIHNPNDPHGTKKRPVANVLTASSNRNLPKHHIQDLIRDAELTKWKVGRGLPCDYFRYIILYIEQSQFEN